jgi:hypothetical protein
MIRRSRHGKYQSLDREQLTREEKESKKAGMAILQNQLKAEQAARFAKNDLILKAIREARS